jgi:transposase-like protein
MEHRKFQRRLNELVAELTYAQAQKAIAALRQRGDGDELQHLLEQRLEDNPKCAHCGSRRIEGWGRERNGLKRRRCLDCRRTFNALTGTPLARLRKKERWLSFAGTLNDSRSVRKAARACNVNKSTALKFELCVNVGDGLSGQAAAFSRPASMPSVNLTPVISFGN